MERKELRESVEVTDKSQLHNVGMRNNFEHFDERLDRWWNDSSRHNYTDLNVMPRAAIKGVDDNDNLSEGQWVCKKCGACDDVARDEIDLEYVTTFYNGDDAGLEDPMCHKSYDSEKAHWGKPMCGKCREEEVVWKNTHGPV